MENRVYRIVLTGGPCGGKTSCKDAIEKHFSDKGISIYHVPESATIFIQGGFNPSQMKDRSQLLAFQENLLWRRHII